MELHDFFENWAGMSEARQARLKRALNKAGLLAPDGGFDARSSRFDDDDDNPVAACFRNCERMIAMAFMRCEKECEDEDEDDYDACYDACSEAIMGMAHGCYQHCEEMVENL